MAIISGSSPHPSGTFPCAWADAVDACDPHRNSGAPTYMENLLSMPGFLDTVTFFTEIDVSAIPDCDLLTVFDALAFIIGIVKEFKSFDASNAYPPEVSQQIVDTMSALDVQYWAVDEEIRTRGLMKDFVASLLN